MDMSEGIKFVGKSLDGIARGVSVNKEGMLLPNFKNGMAYTIGKTKLLTIPTYDGSGQGVHPSVIYIPKEISGYKFWMAFTPFTDGNSAFENPSILASTNGVDWVVPVGLTNPIESAPASGWYADTVLLYDGTKLIVYWSQFGIGGAGKAFFKTSTDGITWTAKTETTGTVGGNITDKGMCLVGGEYVSWFGKVSTLPQFNRSTSKDGIDFSNIVSTAPALVNFSDLSKFGHGTVYQDASGFHFIVAGRDSRENLLGDDAPTCLYYGHSRDGKEITFDPFPILAAGDGFSRRPYTGQIVPDGDGGFLLISSGQMEDGSWGIGSCRMEFNLMNTSNRDVINSIDIPLWDVFELRSSDTQWYGGGVGVPLAVLNYFPNKSFYIRNRLGVSVNIEFNNAVSAHCIKMNEPPVDARIIQDDNSFAPRVLSSNSDVMGGALADTCFPMPTLMSIKAASVPVSGDITIYLKLWR